MIEVRCCHDLAEAEPFRAAINALNLASARPDPFSTFEFYQNHVRNTARFTPGTPPRLWLLLAFSGDELVGYLALKHEVRRVFGLRAARLDLLTAHSADLPHLVARAEQGPAVSAAIFAYLFGRKAEWSLLEFQQQPAASALQPPPLATAAAGCQSRRWPNMPSGAITIGWPSLAAYFAALSKKARSNVSRQMRTLLAAGAVQVLTSSDPAVIGALFQLYQGIEAHSWKAEREAAISSDRKSLEYYAGLMQASQPMRVVIQVLLLDGVPVAGLISGAYGRSLYALHTVYDRRLAHLGPGSAIVLMGVRLAIEGGYEAFSLLRGFGYYKERWLAQMTETESLQIYRSGTPFSWQRRLGDLKRRWLGDAGTGAGALFNPARREAGEGADKKAARSPAPGPDPAAGVLETELKARMPDVPPALPAPEAIASPDERQRYAALTAEVLRGQGEFLSAAQLGEALPFATRRA